MPYSACSHTRRTQPCTSRSRQRTARIAAAARPCRQ
jgi:hypothetical protein